MASKKEQRPQPDGFVRRSQMITTYGPGAMIDLLDQAVLVGGLDFWSYDKTVGVPAFTEPRLRDAIAERFKAAGRSLSQDEPFRLPPLCSDSEPSRFAGTQVLEFPQWFVCQRCRALQHKSALDLKSGRYRHVCSSSKKGEECVPVRFLGACKRGHVEDFRWIDFCHALAGKELCGSPTLQLEEGPTGDFSEIVIRCACGGHNRLSVAMSGLEIRCRGQRPWLGDQGREECEENIRLLVRTASNSYFAQVMSALTIPEPGRELEDGVREAWDVLKSATAELLPHYRNIPKVQIALAAFSDADVMRVVAALQSGTSMPRLPIRTAEFLQLTSAPQEVPGDLPALEDDFFARTAKLEGGLPSGLARIVLASKLREVRAQVGFTRLESVSPDLQGEFDLGVRSARLGLTTDWLPAVEVLGEGVFIQLDEQAVQEWEARTEVKKRALELMAGYDAWSRGMQEPPPFPGARFYMLHSLSHMLITAISLECGYAASAIRERIYCGPSATDKTAMAAILLSTGTSGSEGTLGGLIEQGRRLRGHLQHAYDAGKLCSNDPVCASHSPHEDPSERFLEGAACHGCLFISEPSCERFNRYLDRALVVPTVGRDASLAFFGKRP